jgi:hypothetical protein
MSARLDRLPLEILHLIVGYIRVAQDQERPDEQEPDQPSWYSLSLQPLPALCLVSKRLCSVIQPFLYHEFMPGCDDSWETNLFTWDRRLTPFIRTVAERRDLAACVKRI